MPEPHPLLMRELLIAGIDPGTTVGYAILDTKGNAMKLRSSKQLELNSLIEEIVTHGSVLAIGTDKAKVPCLIEKAAARTGAKVIFPREDLPVSEKEAITKGLEAANSHEKDALAAALFAYKELEPLLQRIRKTLENEGKQNLFMEVTKTVVITGKNIKDTLREIENKETKEEKTATTETKEAPKAHSQHEIMLKRAERENNILKAYNSKLLAKARRLNNEIRRQQKKASPASHDKIREIEKNKNKLIGMMQTIINEKEKRIQRLRKELELVGRIATSGNAVIKKLKNLGHEEVELKNKSTPITEGDILLVENPETFSEKSLEFLQQKSVTLLTRKKPSANVEKLLINAGLNVLPAEGILLESENFAAASRNKLEEIKKMQAGTNALGIIESYKEERKTLI